MRISQEHVLEVVTQSMQYNMTSTVPTIECTEIICSSMQSKDALS